MCSQDFSIQVEGGFKWSLAGPLPFVGSGVRVRPAMNAIKGEPMSKPWIHSLSSARKHGGKPEDYLDIHELMDSSKSTFADNRHRALTHNAWFIGHILEKVFGSVRTNSDGKVYSVRDIGEQHVLEDYGRKFIPTAQDFLQEIEFKDWMQNGRGVPPSYEKVMKKVRRENDGDGSET